MAAVLKSGWSKPSTILFATEIPVQEKAFGFALEQAAEFGADLVLFHAYDGIDLAASEAPAGEGGDSTQARDEKRRLEAFAQRAGDLGIRCKVVARPGAAAEQLLAYLRERRVDRVVMGAHSPGPIGKLLVGSVAEAVLRNSSVPVNIVGPNVFEGAYRNLAARTILCSVSTHDSRGVVARFAAELAARQRASLIVQHVIPFQESAETLAVRTLAQIEDELHGLIPEPLQGRISTRVRAVLGDPAEELLQQSRAQRASLIVLGARGASHFAAVTRAGVVYKVLAYAPCPVITLSPIVLAKCGAREENTAGREAARSSEVCMAGVF
jgi:nucleotide-binding universal stress UspA family protein